MHRVVQPDDELLGQAWFLLSGAAGTFFFPFVPVFLSSRGMTSSQLGVLAAVRPWLAAPTSLAATAVADRLRLHRPLLVASLVVSTLMRAALPLLPGLTALSGLLLASELVGAPTGVVADATILSRCRTEGDYGKLRLWASVGAVASGLAAGALTDWLGDGAAFGAFLALSLPLFWVASQLSYNYASAGGTEADQTAGELLGGAQQGVGGRGQQPGAARQRRTPARAAHSRAAEPSGAAATPAQPPGPSLAELLLQPQALLFLARCLLMGLGYGIIMAFLFVYLRGLGAPKMLLGLVLMVSCCAEVPAFRLSGEVLARLGGPAVLDAALLLLAVRLAGYSLLPALPTLWAVLPMELLQGVTYACGWGAATVQATKLAPPELGATMQAVFQAMYLGVGAGLGGLAGGAIMESRGGQTLFAWSSAAVLVGWAALRVLERVATGAAATKGAKSA